MNKYNMILQIRYVGVVGVVGVGVVGVVRNVTIRVRYEKLVSERFLPTPCSLIYQFLIF